MFTNYGLVAPHVPEGTRGPPLTRGPDIELAHGGPALVHPGEGQRLGSQLLGQGNLMIIIFTILSLNILHDNLLLYQM